MHHVTLHDLDNIVQCMLSWPVHINRVMPGTSSMAQPGSLWPGLAHGAFAMAAHASLWPNLAHCGPAWLTAAWSGLAHWAVAAAKDVRCYPPIHIPCSNTSTCHLQNSLRAEAGAVQIIAEAD